MGHVTVARLNFLIVLNPLLNGVITLPDPDRRQLCHGIFDTGLELFVISKNIGSANASLEQFHRYLDVHRGRICKVKRPTIRHPIGVLRRVGRSRGQITVLIRDHK